MRALSPLILSIAALVGGCTSILPDAGDLAPRLSLDAGRIGEGRTGAPIPTNLVIADPTAEAVYNTFNVAVLTAPLQYEYLVDAEWTDRVPVLFRLFVERRFENAGVVTAVGDRGDVPISDYELKTDIRAFTIDRTRGTEEVEVTFGARLVDDKGRTLGTRVFSEVLAPEGEGRMATVAAINDAARQTTDDLIAWTRDLILVAED